MTDLAALQKIIETGADLPLPLAEELAETFGDVPKPDSKEEFNEFDKAIQFEEYLLTGSYSSTQPPTIAKPRRLEVLWAHIGSNLLDINEGDEDKRMLFQINNGLMFQEEKTNETLYLIEEIFKNRRIEGFRDNASPATEKQNAPQPLSKLEQLEQMMHNKKNNDTPSHS